MDIVTYLMKLEAEYNFTMKPLDGYKLEINTSPGVIIDSKIREMIRLDKDFYMKAVKIRRSREELQELQSQINFSEHQFEVRDKLRIIIFEDSECIWNHTDFKSCTSKLIQCHICKLKAKVDEGSTTNAVL